MSSRIIFFGIMLVVFVYCGQNEKETKPKTVRPAPEFNVTVPDFNDRQPNGGLLRYHLAGKIFEDDYFVALFTPRGDLFRTDNLQLYNYNIGSDKYPQFIISIDNLESQLSLWQGKTFPLNFCSLTVVGNTVPLNSEGQVTLTKISDSVIEGKFSGNMINVVKNKKFPIKGEFKAILEVNI